MKNNVGLVTVTYNSEGDMDEFLKSCSNQIHKDFKLYIIDNNSSDSTLDLIKKNNEIYNLKINIQEVNENKGISYGNNLGIKKAISDGCDWIVLINNDTAFEPNLISSLINTEYSINVPLITYYDEPKKIWFYKGFFNKFRGFTGTHFMKNKFVSEINTKEIEFTEYSPTCCMAIKKEIFKKVGLMDEDFFVYFDDTDFTYRILSHKIKIKINKDVILKHKVGSSSGGVLSDFTIEATSKNRVIFMRKHLGTFYIFVNLPIFAIFYLIRFLLINRSYKKFKLSVKASYIGLTKSLSPPKYCD